MFLAFFQILFIDGFMFKDYICFYIQLMAIGVVTTKWLLAMIMWFFAITTWFMATRRWYNCNNKVVNSNMEHPEILS